MKYNNLMFTAFFSAFLLSLFLRSPSLLFVIVLFLCIVSVLTKRNYLMKFSGGWRFWILPSLFLILAPLFFTDGFFWSKKGVLNSVSIFLHLYIFNMFLNFLNSILSPYKIYHFLEKKKMKRSATAAFLALSCLSRFKREIVFLNFYCSIYTGSRYYFLKNPVIFFYALARNAFKAAVDLSRLLYLRRIEL